MTDPGEDICDALVAYVTTLAQPDVSLVGQVDRTDNPLKALELEYEQLKVLFYATSEEATKIGRSGQCLEHFTVSMVVIRKLNAEYTKSVLGQYVREIKKAIRGAGTMAGCHWSGEATPVKTDAQQIHQHGQFCSISEFTYSTAG